jgi:Ca2+-binding RTX toxin-like protein
MLLTGTGNIDGTGNAANNTLTGNAANNVLSGGAGNDTLDGQAGDDTLIGGRGNDTLIGGAGNDTYVYNMGDDLDRIVETGGSDTLRFGPGFSLANVALRLSKSGTTTTAHVRILDAGGCEQPGQGFDFDMLSDSQGKPSSPIESFVLSDGSVKTWQDLLIKQATTFGANTTQPITTGRDDDIIFAGNKDKVIHSGTGNDIVYGGNGHDTIYGEGGDDYLQAGNKSSTLDGGCGVDILVGGRDGDVLRDVDAMDNGALLGGGGNDSITAGAASDFIAGGRDDDLIQAGAGYNVIAFNAGDGRDTILPAPGARNALSLGNDVESEDLTFRKLGSDLILQLDDGDDQITFKDWYASSQNQNFVTLQVIGENFGQDGEHGDGHADENRAELYDFKALVAKFDAARAVNPQLSSWHLMNGLLDAHLAGSDSAALGGDLAMVYAQQGSLSGMNLAAAQAVLKDPQFGQMAQATHAWSNIDNGPMRIA